MLNWALHHDRHLRFSHISVITSMIIEVLLVYFVAYPLALFTEHIKVSLKAVFHLPFNEVVVLSL